jgi:hypothetical protein
MLHETNYRIKHLVNILTQSAEDGAAKPVYYESRVINLGL